MAQLAILRPIPTRVGPMACASRYISAADQAFIGGDLYAGGHLDDDLALLLAEVRT